MERISLDALNSLPKKEDDLRVKKCSPSQSIESGKQKDRRENGPEHGARSFYQTLRNEIEKQKLKDEEKKKSI
jgi:hypothetical protein